MNFSISRGTPLTAEEQRVGLVWAWHNKWTLCMKFLAKGKPIWATTPSMATEVNSLPTRMRRFREHHKQACPSVCVSAFLIYGARFISLEFGRLEDTAWLWTFGTSESSKAMDRICGHCIESKAIDIPTIAISGPPCPNIWTGIDLLRVHFLQTNDGTLTIGRIRGSRASWGPKCSRLQLMPPPTWLYLITKVFPKNREKILRL